MGMPRKFDSYLLICYAEPNNANQRFVFQCKLGDKTVGTLSFHTGNTLPHMFDGNGNPIIRFDVSDFSNVYTMLLHENPLYLYLSDDLSDAHLTTEVRTPEPIGEEE